MWPTIASSQVNPNGKRTLWHTGNEIESLQIQRETPSIFLSLSQFPTLSLNFSLAISLSLSLSQFLSFISPTSSFFIDKGHVRRCLLTNQNQRTYQKSTLRTSWHWTSSPRTVKTLIFIAMSPNL
jgi:hypothetical protein